MPAYSKLFEVLPEYYDHVILVGISSTFVNLWMGGNVVRARKKYNVKYPALYSPDCDEFNCIQRAHQNTLEGYPTFLLLLFVGGLTNPRFAAGCGLTYMIGRVLYARGYSTGKPENRRPGAIIDHISLIGLLGSSVCLLVRRSGLLGSN